NLLVNATNVAGCTLSFSNNIDKFQSQYGQPAPQSWQLLGYLTNNPGSVTPVFTVYLKSGRVSAGEESRMDVDCFRFTSLDPCLTVPPPAVTGPLFADAGSVVVGGISPTATNVAVYQKSGSGMVKIGSLTVSSAPAA